jgi:hypothetical protein
MLMMLYTNARYPSPLWPYLYTGAPSYTDPEGRHKITVHIYPSALDRPVLMYHLQELNVSANRTEFKEIEVAYCSLLFVEGLDSLYATHKGDTARFEDGRSFPSGGFIAKDRLLHRRLLEAFTGAISSLPSVEGFQTGWSSLFRQRVQVEEVILRQQRKRHDQTGIEESIRLDSLLLALTYQLDTCSIRTEKLTSTVPTTASFPSNASPGSPRTLTLSSVDTNGVHVETILLSC